MSRVDKKWSLWWKGLYELWWSLVGSLFRDMLSFSLGNGCTVRFWVDPWVEGRVLLSERYPALFGCL